MSETRAGELLGQLLKRYKLEAGLRRGRVLALWPEVAGEMLARLTEPLRLERGELLVRAESAALAHQLTYQREEFVRRYANLVGEGVVENVRFFAGRLRQTPPPSHQPPEAEPREPVALPLELAKKLTAWTKQAPPELRPAVEHAGRAVLAAQLREGAAGRCPVCELPNAADEPCRYCRPLLAEPLVRRAARALEKNPLAEPLAGDMLAAARWLAAERLRSQIEDLAPQALEDRGLLPLLADRVRRFVALPVYGEEPAERARRLSETVRTLVKDL